MKVKDFVKSIITDVHSAVEECSNELNYEMHIAKPHNGNESIEFEVAVAVEANNAISGGGGVEVIGFNIGAKNENEYKNSSISKVKFGVYIATEDKIKQSERRNSIKQQNNQY